MDYTANAFAGWLANNPAAGARYEYYRGFLARDTDKTSGLSETDRAEVKVLRDVVWSHYERGRVLLTQKRHGSGDYSYFATAARQRHAAET